MLRSGRYDRDVRPGAPVRVSPAGGGLPVWRGDGRKLFYLTPAGDLMAVSILAKSLGGLSNVGAPHLLVRVVTHEPYSSGVEPYDAAPVGQRFILNAENRTAPPLTLLVPWPRKGSELR